MRRLLPFLTLLPLALLGGCSGGEGEEMVGSTAPEIKVETLLAPAADISLASKRGKVVLLDFWATWCGPCRAVTPTLEKVYANHKADGLEAMAIDSGEAREIVALVEKHRPHAMPVYLDPDAKATRAFGASGLPTIAVIDRKGQIVYRTVGVPDDVEAQLEAAVGKALGSK